MTKMLNSLTWIAPAMTGVLSVVAIFADGGVTRLRVILAVLAGLCAVISVYLAFQGATESNRSRGYLETLIRSMELPYFIIKKLSSVIREIANEHNWILASQENLPLTTIFNFRNSQNNDEGLLLMSDAEVKDVWILGEKERAVYIRKRLTGINIGENDYLDEVIRQTISEVIEGPIYVGTHNAKDGEKA